MATRVVYYSWKGHTEKVAVALAGMLGAELVRIEPARQGGIAINAMKAFFGMKSPIRQAKTDLTGIDTLIIATPVWAGKVPPYVNAYLDAVTGGEGKSFHVLAEMGGRGDQTAISVVRRTLEQKGMRYGTSATTVERDVDAGSFTGALDTFAAAIRR